MSNTWPENDLVEQLNLKQKQGLLRSLTPLRNAGQGRIEIDSESYLNLAGNDYLGVGSNLELLKEFYARLDPADPANCLQLFAAGSGASRLLTGNHELYQLLEQQLASLYKVDKVLIFNSGYHLNIGLLPALARRSDLILADKLCHASLIDGMRLSRARVIRYPHLDYNRIEDLLKKYRHQYKNIFLVTESIFSMDGDCVDLNILTQLKKQYRLVLYVDEAHAVGVRGRQGLGLAEEQETGTEIDLLAGTFGKAWAGQGAFVACSEVIYDFLVNTTRSFIFTTALPPVNIHWLNFLLPRIINMEHERRQLSRLSATLRDAFNAVGLDCGRTTSQIIPIILGDAAKTVKTARELQQQGYWLSGVRPPTVPPGSSRLRISLNAGLDEQHLKPLPEIISGLV